MSVFNKDFLEMIELTEENSKLRAELENYRGIAEQMGAKKAVSERDKVLKQLIDLKLFIVKNLNDAIKCENNNIGNEDYDFWHGKVIAYNEILQKL